MAILRSTAPSQRDREELARSAEEARDASFAPVNWSQTQRYLNPPANTPYALEYAFHLLGNIRGKSVLDLGCGKGENLVRLAARGAQVVGLDISPELVRLAERRLQSVGAQADVIVGSAYDTGLPDESVDVIFCIALVHHLEIPRVHAEMRRILKAGGFVVLSEPVRFSRLYDRLRRLLPACPNVSEHEHPLTKAEFELIVGGFAVEDLRYFRLPFVPLAERLLGKTAHSARRFSARLMAKHRALEHLATVVVVKLRKGNGIGAAVLTSS